MVKAIAWQVSARSPGLTGPGARSAIIRPVLPQDAGPMQEFVRGLSSRARYLRFQTGLHELSPWLLERFTKVDYDRQMALIAVLFGSGREMVIARRGPAERRGPANGRALGRGQSAAIGDAR